LGLGTQGFSGTTSHAAGTSISGGRLTFCEQQTGSGNFTITAPGARLELQHDLRAGQGF